MDGHELSTTVDDYVQRTRTTTVSTTVDTTPDTTQPLRVTSNPVIGSADWMARSAKLYTRVTAKIQPGDAIDLCSSWIDVSSVLHDTQTTQRFSLDGGLTYTYRYARLVRFRGGSTDSKTVGCVMKHSFVSHSLRMARAAVSRSILRDLAAEYSKAKSTKRVSFQMDNGDPVSTESIQGQGNQQSTKEENTIITADTSVEKTLDTSIPNPISVASTEPTSSFRKLTDRWMVLKNFTVDTTYDVGKEIFRYRLPVDLYSSAKCAPNIVPFEAYAYAQLQYEFRIVMNANKFQAGRLIVAYRNDTFGAPSSSYSVAGMLARPHVIIDLCSRNEGHLTVPWKYHAAFVRLVNTPSTTSSVTAGECASLEAVVMSKLRVGPDGTTNAGGTVYYRIKKADFAGMSYRVAFQGPDEMIESVLPLKTMGAAAAGVETFVQQMGRSPNQDKPNDPRAVVFIPKPRSMFPNVRGVDDATALRSSPMAATSFNKIHGIMSEPKSPYELARIWGLRSTAPWKTSDAAGTRIIDMIIDPTVRSTASQAALTTLEQACSMFQFWTGVVEVRLDFVATTFHQGSVMISLEFNRPVTTTDLCSTSSTYTKTFHLGDRRSVTIKVPFIYDTLFRRANGTILRVTPNKGGYPAEKDWLRLAPSLSTSPHARLRVTVVNPLKPVQSVTTELEVLMFWRAGSNFHLMGLKQCDYTDSRSATPGNRIRALPNDFYGETYVTPELDAKHVAGVQMDNGVDTGSKEDEDTTATFSDGVSARGLQSVDDTLDFKDILRRPTIMLIDRLVKQTGVTGTGLAPEFPNALAVRIGFWIPVLPPSRTITHSTVDSIPSDTWFDGGSLAVSPSTAIVNMFRLWRGSSKYTFVFNPTSTCDVVYITYVPHSGAVCVGNRCFPFNQVDNPPNNPNFAYPYSAGYATEIVSMSINRTASIVVPYETELNWTVAWEDDPVKNYSWRDKGYLNAGHIVIQAPHGDTDVTVFWSAGDDFEMCDFYGPSYSYNEAGLWRLDDTGDAPKTTEVMSADMRAAIAQRRIPSASTKKKSPSVIRTPSRTVTGERDTVDRGPGPSRAEPSAVQQDAAVASSASIPTTHRATRTPVIPAPGSYADWTEYWSNFYSLNPEYTNEMVQEAGQHYVQPATGSAAPSSQMDRGNAENPAARDFRASGVMAKVIDAVTSVSPRMVRNVALSAVPIVGVPATVAVTAAEVSDKAVKSLEKMDATVTKMGELADIVGVNVEAISHVLKNAVDSIVDKLQGVMDGAAAVYNLLLDVFLAWYHKSWVVVGVGIVRLVTSSLGSAALEIGLTWGGKIGNAIQELVASMTRVETQADMSPLEAFVGVLAGFIGTVMGVVMDPSDTSYIKSFFTRITKVAGIAYFVQVLSFVRTTFKALTELVMRALGRVSPEAAALKAFAGKHEEIQSFVKDAQDIISEANYAMWHVPGFKVRVWKTVLQAMQIQRCLAVLPHNTASPVLSKVCNDVIKISQEKFRDLAACPVRYEPFVVCIEGETNIGKSFMIEELVTRLLTAVGYNAPATGVTYTRQPGAPYWSGYVDQPAVVYDDWMQMNETAAMTTQITELFQLKTPNTFIPNMAHLEEKKIKANPLIVVLACNDAYPNVPVANSTEAVYRRRNVVVYARKREIYADTDTRDIDPEVLREFGHLDLAFYDDPKDHESFSDEWISFDEFMEDLTEAFVGYHEMEMRNVNNRMEQLFRLNRTVPPHLINLDDPFKIYYSTDVRQMVADNLEMWVPSATLERDVELVYQALVQAERGLRDNAGDAPAAVQVPPGAVAAQLDWGAIVQAVSAAVLISGTFWAHAIACIRKTTHAVGQYLSNYSPTLANAPRMTCSVCLSDDAIVTRACPNAVSNGGRVRLAHVVCDECRRRLENNRCPVCRSTEFPISILSQAEMTWVTHVITFMGRTSCSISDALEVPGNLLFGVADAERALDIIALVANALLFLTVPEAQTFEFCVYVGVRSMISMGDWYMRGDALASRAAVHAQMENEESRPSTPERWDESDNEAPDSVLRNLDATVDSATRETTSEDEHLSTPSTSGGSNASSRSRNTRRRPRALLNAGHATPQRVTPQREPTPADQLFALRVHDLEMRGRRACTDAGVAVCQHVLLRGDSITDVAYSEGRWRVTYMTNFLAIEDVPCPENFDCAWHGERGKEAQRIFYERYLNARREELMRAVAQWSSAREDRRPYYAKQVPHVMQPEWMYRPIALDPQGLALLEPSWWDKLCETWSSFGVILKLCVGAALACATLLAGYKLHQALFTHSPGVPTAVEAVGEAGAVSADGTLASLVTIESQYPRGEHTTHASPRVEVRRPPRVHHQAIDDLDDVVEGYIQKNAVAAELWDGDVLKRVLHGYGICDHYVMIPYHYVKLLVSRQYTIKIGPTASPNMRTVVLPEHRDFRRTINTDFVMWRWPPSTNSFKDIRKFFIKEKDLDNHLPADATLYVLPGRTGTCILAQGVRLQGAQGSICVHAPDGEIMDVQDVLVYNYSQAGACGSLLKVRHSQRPLIGMHVAGVGERQDGIGYAIILTKEILDAAVGDDVVYEPPILDDVIPDAQCGIVFPPEIMVEYHGVLPDGKVPFTPRKSKLVRSSVFGSEGLTEDVRPAMMSKSEPGYPHADSPLYAGCTAHGRLTHDFPTSLVEVADEYIGTLLDSMLPRLVDPKKLTPEEAVIGLPGHDYYDPMDLKTSSGYPLMLGPDSHKETFVEIERDDTDRPIKCKLKPELQRIVDEAHATRSSGKRYPTLWVDTLKDEKRPTPKAMKYGGTRIICNGPFEHAIAMRQNFLHFSAAFMAQRWDLHHMVGINATGPEWHMLATKLKHKSTNVVTLDYSNFGPCFNARMCEVAVKHIKRWTKQHVAGVNEAEMDTLMLEVQNSYHVCGGTVYSQVAGAPSGNQMTSVINSLVNIGYVTCMWSALMGEHLKAKGLSPMAEFRKHVCLYVYGDDLIMTVRQYEDMFNALTISTELAKYKIVATDAAKTGTITPTVPFMEAEFLKRKFAWNGQRNKWMSQLRASTLRGTTQWVWKSPNRDESTRVNCEVAVMNAHGHGKEYFNEFKTKVNNALTRRRIEPVYLTWEEVDSLFFDHGFDMKYF